MALFTLDCFSTSDNFTARPKAFSFVRGAVKNDTTLDRYEFFDGLRRGASSSTLKSSKNVVSCRNDMCRLIDTQKLIVVPTVDITNRLSDLICENSECPLDERQRLYDVLSSPRCPIYHLYTLGYHGPIFTRHPSTGRVTRHEFPYESLPPFSMTVTPFMCLVRAMKSADSSAIVAPSSRLPENLASSLADFYTYFSDDPSLDFYVDARSLGNFPQRRVPYQQWQLDVPELTDGPTASSGKRTRSSSESSDSDEEDANEEELPMPDIGSWRLRAGVAKTARSSDKKLSAYAREPVGIAEDMELVKNTWREVLERKAGSEKNEKAREHYIRLAQPTIKPAQKPNPRRPAKRARR